MSVTVKLVNGTQKTVEVPDLGITVSEFTKLTAPVVDIPADEQRVVLRGRVLKENDILSAVGMEHGNAVHIVRSKKKEAAAAPAKPAAETTSAPSATTAPPAPSTQPAVSQPASTSVNPYAALAGGAFGAAPPTAGSGSAAMDNANWASAGFGAGWTPSPDQALQMMQNPMMMQLMQNAMRDPQFVQQMMQSNPYLANMPPEVIQQTMQMMNNPEMMRSMMSMMSGMSGAQGGGAAPTAGASLQQQQLAGSAAPPSGFGGAGFNPALFAPPPPQGDPREIYRDQLQQLREMGFPNEDANIAALQQSQGNISFAIERLFNA